MLGVVTVLILVATQDAGDPALPALRAAVTEAVHGEANVVIESRASLPSDEEALALASTTHAGVVAELRWDGTDREHVSMHVHVGRTPMWFDRELGFRRTDAAAERGRAIGVVLAAMLPEVEPNDEASPPPPPAPPAPPTPVPAPTSHGKLEAPSNAPPPATRPPENEARVAIGVKGLGSVGLGGPAPEAGGGLDVSWVATPRLALRVAGDARFGRVSAAHGTSQRWVFGGGAALTLARVHPFEFALRADVLASALSLSRTAVPTSAPSRAARWLPALDLAGEWGWSLTPAFAIVAAVVVEAELGTTDIVIDGGIAATPAPVHAIGELGARIRF